MNHVKGLAHSAIESPTIVERFVSLIPLPYPLAAFFWMAVPFGPVGFFIVNYLSTGSIPPFLANLPNVILNFLLPFYAFLIVRYMRLRVVDAEGPIAERLAGGIQDYRLAFGRITQTTPVVLLTAVLGTVFAAIDVSLGILSSVPAVSVFNVIVAFVSSFAFMGYLWEFVAVSWGLHKLGGSSLRLGSFLEDRMMGAKPMGNLALSLTIAYYGVLLLSLLLLSTFLPSSIEGTAMFVTFLILGVALFLLPLNSIHARMQAEKRRLLREIGARYPPINKEPYPSPRKESATLEDVHTRLARLTDLKEVEMLDRKVAALPTWPFDIQIVSKFITIALSVAAVLASRLITGFLHI